ncbi:MAG: DUF5752 family protein [Acidobacteriota bacterium]|nr:DUF5752 family protein [Acidobacteriota bacterium]
MTNHKSFIFDTELHLVVLTGIKVCSLTDLRAQLAKVPSSSIFFHTHQEYLAHEFQRSPPYYNDFARWVSQAMREEPLAEKLAAIDLLAFTTIRQLRAAIIDTIDTYLDQLSRPSYECRPEEAFHFCRSRSFVLPTGIVAHDVDEFFDKVAHISHASLYFHFFEARLRLRRRTSDFSRWLTDRGRPDLAEAIDALNPYVRTLDELRRDIVALGAGEAAT